jgi:hypothetical protein
MAGVPLHSPGMRRSKRTGRPTKSGCSVSKNIPRLEMFNVVAVCPQSKGEFIMENKNGIFSLNRGVIRCSVTNNICCRLLRAVARKIADCFARYLCPASTVSRKTTNGYLILHTLFSYRCAIPTSCSQFTGIRGWSGRPAQVTLQTNRAGGHASFAG